MKKGFTIIELMIVVIIIGILATFAVPQYLSAIERGKQGKARHALGLIAEAEKMYRAEYDSYITVTDGTFNNVFSSYIELAEIDADTDWDYAVTGATTTFTATATRKAGKNATKTITLTENGVWGGTFKP